MTTPTPHKHAALIKQWADDTSQPVWVWSSSAGWFDASDGGETTPSWSPSSTYALGPKPTQPPRKTCTLAGVEFPVPETTAPASGASYYIPTTAGHPAHIEWANDRTDKMYLAAGMIHLDREAALAHALALLAANKQAIEAAR